MPNKLAANNYESAHLISAEYIGGDEDLRIFCGDDLTTDASVTQRELNEAARLHERWLGEKSGGEMADFSGMELAELDFEGLRFEAGSFRGARIHACNLCGNFTFTDFRGAEIRNCGAAYASFENADFTDAVCKNCDFIEAKLDGAHLRRAVFQYCDFSRAVMECCDMTGARLDENPHRVADTAMSWGGEPPAREAETLISEGKFIAGMLGLGLEDAEKIPEWMDEAWSRAAQAAAFDEDASAPEIAYRQLLAQYCDAFCEVRRQFSTAAEAIFNHGEEFSPRDLPCAAAYLAGGGSFRVARSLMLSGLFDRHTGDFARLQECAETLVAQAIEDAQDGETLVDLEDAMAASGVPERYDFELADLLRDREELAGVQFDPNAHTALLEIEPAFLRQGWQQIIASM